MSQTWTEALMQLDDVTLDRLCRLSCPTNREMTQVVDAFKDLRKDRDQLLVALKTLDPSNKALAGR